ncbi:MAG: phosphoribosylamine--glycine ligase [Bacteroidetes bacterium]|nr:phosphoribosylamine--glycine ligase [Bacteroidota bacterium]
MDILVIGSGGREHALVWALRRSPGVRRLLCAPGNPGIAKLAEIVPVHADDIPALVQLALRERVDLTVVGPEQPLAQGIADEFARHDLALFGPTRDAAALEWSKAFAKEFMTRHGIPTARYAIAGGEDLPQAHALLDTFQLPVVLKADGLAAGKGVIICSSADEAHAVLEEMLSGRSFGKAGSHAVIEECLVGEEASVFAITDGDAYVLLAPAQDHKRVFEGDRGKNTGGMGAYAPAPAVTPHIMQTVVERVLRPTLAGMASEGRPYCGCLYIGLMLTSQGPRVIEYNCRFGDPETQVVLPLFRGDLARTLQAAATGTLREITASHWRFEDSATAACVVLAAGGYPGEYKTGNPILGLDEAEGLEGVVAFHAGTRLQGADLVTAGGRVLGVSAMCASGGLARTLQRCYDAVQKIRFENMHYRRDIGYRALGVSSSSNRNEQ